MDAAPGLMGSNPAADHLACSGRRSPLSPTFRRRLMITCDGLDQPCPGPEPDRLTTWRGYEVIYSFGWELDERKRLTVRKVPGHAWEAAVEDPEMSASVMRARAAPMNAATI